MKKIAIVFAIAATLSGCASVGSSQLATHNEETLSEQIIIGTTTKADLTQALGSPFAKSFDANGGEQWSYMHSKASADAVNFVPFAALFGTSTSGETKQLTVIFDDDGVVKNYLMNTSDTGIRTGVFSD